MNNNDLLRLEELLTRACRKHLNSGGTLIRGRFWCGDDKRLCPIRALLNQKEKERPLLSVIKDWFSLKGAAIIASAPSPTNPTNAALLSPDERLKPAKTYDILLSEAVGFTVSYAELWNIVWGFDGGYEAPTIDSLLACYDMGMRLREKFKPETPKD